MSAAVSTGTAPGRESVRDGVGHDQVRPLYLDRCAALCGAPGSPAV